jgi:hypothetical protein
VVCQPYNTLLRADVMCLNMILLDALHGRLLITFILQDGVIKSLPFLPDAVRSRHVHSRLYTLLPVALSRD